MKNCKNCQGEISKEFVFCPLCGARADGNKECPACSALSAEQFSFCPSCGFNFDGQKQSEKTQEAKYSQPAPAAEQAHEAAAEQARQSAAAPLPRVKRTRKSFRQIISGEKSSTNFVLNCVALAFSIAMLFILAFAPMTKIKLDFSNMPVEFKGKSKIELRINYIDTTSAAAKSLFYTKRDWAGNRTTEKFMQELTLLQSKFSTGKPVDLRSSQRNMNRLNLAELNIISDALTQEGIKTPSVFWMLAAWCVMTALIVLDILLIVFLLKRIIKLDFSKYRSKLLAPFGILLFTAVFMFGHSSHAFNLGVAAGKEIPISTAVVLPIILLSIIGLTYLIYDIIEKGFKKVGRYAFALSGAFLALFLGLAGRGGIIKISSEVDDRLYSTNIAPSSIVSVLDKAAEYIKVPHGPALEEYGADKIIADFTSSVQYMDEASPDLAKLMHDEFTFTILSCYEFTVSEVSTLAILSVTSILSIIAGVLPALLLVFALKRLTADDDNISKPYILSIIAAGVYFILLALDITTVIMLNNSFDSTILLQSDNILGQPSIDLRAAITFKAVISLVLAAGLFAVYTVKKLLYKKRAIQLQDEAIN